MFVSLGRECEGIHFAVNYLETWQKKQSGRTDVDMAALSMSAKEKRVVVIGGGDTGVDCIATAARQARVVVVIVAAAESHVACFFVLPHCFTTVLKCKFNKNFISSFFAIPVKWIFK